MLTSEAGPARPTIGRRDMSVAAIFAPVGSVLRATGPGDAAHAGFGAGAAIAGFFANGGSVLWLLPEGVQDADLFAALDAISDVSILCLRESRVTRDRGQGALDWAGRRGGMLIAAAPEGLSGKSLIHWRDDAFGASPDVAVYSPQAVQAGTEGPVSPAGAVAGVWSRVARGRGVWKAPAGADASLVGVERLVRRIDAAEEALLTAEGINVLRALPDGPAVWGARTSSGSAAPEDRYIAVRRLAKMVERSIVDGTGWVMFEPNDEPLWSDLRFVVGGFLGDLFRDGAFAGERASEACFVRCGHDTMSAADIDRGIVTVMVGFAPVRPAEFVVITIRLRALSR